MYELIKLFTYTFFTFENRDNMADEIKPQGNMIGQAIGGLAGLASNLIGGFISNRSQDKTARENKELAEYSYSKDLEMWNRTNEYNLPSSQMARLREAGLNPNLVYGSGGAKTESATMPKYNAPTMDYNYKPMLDPLQALGAFQDFQLRGAQINNARAQTKNIEADTALKVTNEFVNAWKYKGWAAGIGHQNEILNQAKLKAQRENRIADALEPFQADMFKATLNQKTQDARLKEMQGNMYDWNAWTRILQGFGVKLPSFRK